MQRKSLGQAGAARGGDKGRIVTVTPPAPHEGIGNALRATYAPGGDALPDDMMALLARLDRH